MIFLIKKAFEASLQAAIVCGVVCAFLLFCAEIASSAEVFYQFDEALWVGAAGEVNDNSGNNYHATATNGPTTEAISPAIPGNPGTCYYGVFDGVDDYVALPSGYPNLTTDYTITAWIRTTDNTRSGQRILIDDPNNTQGFGFSLGDGGTGRVRFFSRSTSPIILDTPNVVANNTWYFVAAVADISNNTKRIYVYDQAGNQMAAVSDTYTGSWGYDVGDASMGGENNSSGESGSNFHFVGNIDEVAVHDGALTEAQIIALKNTTRICISPVAEYRFDLCTETNFVIDDSGNGFDGSVLNGPLAIDTGKICNGAYFDGIDDYIEIDDSDLFDNTAALTIAGWINPEDIRIPPPTGNARGIVSKRNTYSSEVAYGVFFYSSVGDGRIYVDLDTTNNRFASNTVIPEDTWTHFAVVFDGSLPVNERAKLYINGVLDKVAAESSTTIPDYNSNLYIGNLYTGSSVLKVYKGMLDEMRIMPEALSQADIEALFAESRSGCQVCGFDHLRIEHTGVGLTCQHSDITLRACSDAACTSESVAPVTVTMIPATANPPTWIGGDTQTFTGHQSFQLRETLPGAVTLGLANPNPIPANGYKCFDSGVEGDCYINFYDSGFIFAVPDLTSGQTSSSISIQAVRMDDTTQACIADGGFANANKTVNFWSTYVNPASGTEQISLSGTNIAVASPGTGVSLNFDANAATNFTVNYPDAGQMQLNARYDGIGAEEAGLVMLGADSFIARPVGLCIYTDDAGAECAAGNGSCSVFKRVDEVFNLKVKGVCWESTGDTDYCSGNSTTQNFQLSSIPLTHTLVTPSGGSAGNISVPSINVAAADNGEHVISNQTVSEVGVYTFTATPPNYLGAFLPVATSANIGRFTPDHFVTSVVNNGVLQDGCSGFTYTGQSFSYAAPDFPEMLITATGSAGNATVNYRDDFVKLTDPATQISMPAVNADASNLGADTVTLLNITWTPAASSLNANGDGTLNFTLGADQFTYMRDPNALVAPFTSDIQLSVVSISDSDGISATGLPRLFLPAGTDIRYGRMQLQNAYGPETLPLTIPVLTEYYNGSGFVLNSLDNCSAYASLNLTFSNYQGHLASGDTTVSGNGILFSGLGNSLSLSASGVGNDGSVDLLYDLDASGLSWLKPGGNNPTAKATFGIFKGNQRLIYMRESVW
ncbi:MAG: LamG domain-containing protein [Desulfuromusa sp.]|nr:LamG domain-containing protein [Desulfuromusa sp.]